MTPAQFRNLIIGDHIWFEEVKYRLYDIGYEKIYATNCGIVTFFDITKCRLITKYPTKPKCRLELID